MNLKEIVAVSGLSGLYKVQANRPDGLIVQGFEEEKSKFLSSRKHVFTPLEGITVYTLTDNKELEEIFLKMKEAAAAPDPKKVSSQELKDYFKTVLPDYDEDRVYVSDIKKLIKWFAILDKHNMVKASKKEEEKEEEDSKEKEPRSDKKEAAAKEQEKPLKKAGKKNTTKKTTKTKKSTKKEDKK